METFDGDSAIEARVAPLVYFAHPSRAHRRHNFVGAKPVSGRECHGGSHNCTLMPSLQRDLGAVGAVERVRDLGGEVEGLAERKRASSDPRGEGLAFSRIQGGSSVARKLRESLFVVGKRRYQTSEPWPSSAVDTCPVSPFSERRDADGLTASSIAAGLP